MHPNVSSNGIQNYVQNPPLFILYPTYFEV